MLYPQMVLPCLKPPFRTTVAVNAVLPKCTHEGKMWSRFELLPLQTKKKLKPQT